MTISTNSSVGIALSKAAAEISGSLLNADAEFRALGIPADIRKDVLKKIAVYSKRMIFDHVDETLNSIFDMEKILENITQQGMDNETVTVTDEPVNTPETQQPDEPAPKTMYTEEFCEKLIQGEIPAHTGYTKAIQRITKEDAGLVLVMIGLDHPAAKYVYKYLVRQKRAQYRETMAHNTLLFREKMLIPFVSQDLIPYI